MWLRFEQEEQIEQYTVTWLIWRQHCSYIWFQGWRSVGLVVCYLQGHVSVWSVVFGKMVLAAASLLGFCGFRISVWLFISGLAVVSPCERFTDDGLFIDKNHSLNNTQTNLSAFSWDGDSIWLSFQESEQIEHFTGIGWICGNIVAILDCIGCCLSCS